MRKLSVIRSNEPTNEVDVSSVEETLGVCFSEEYKEFLCIYNGGLFEEQLIDLNGDETNIIFLGVNGEKDLVNINSLYLGRLPNKAIAVGMDPGGDLVCLSLEKTSYNCVYYWRAEEEIAEQSLSDLIKLGSSFFEFLDRLEEDAE